MNRTIIFISVSLLILVLLYWTRFQIVEVHDADHMAFYKINRLTGNIEFILGDEAREVSR